MTYEKTVAAALSETRSKFALAEALALDIPPKRRGPTPQDEQTVTQYLIEAREQIIAAGGEPRAVDTLDGYRRTALWVSGDVARNFQWVPGISFSAHNEARKAGLTYEQFAATPAKTVDAMRAASGRAGTDGPPENIVRGMPPEQKAEIVREALADPEVADRVVADPQTRSQVRGALAERDRELGRELAEKLKPELAEPQPNPLMLVADFRALHRTVEQISARVARGGSVVNAAERDALLEEIQWLRNALELIEAGLRGGSLDIALAQILGEDR